MALQEFRDPAAAIDAPGDRGGSRPLAGAPALRSFLVQLGPVLLIHAPSDASHAWCLHTSIDSFGVRESLRIAEGRVYRLPDSDFLGWERLASHCGAGCEGAARGWPPTPRLASLVQSDAHAWRPVARISAPGWEQVQQVLRIESATLARPLARG
jgi:hypothetical protein